MQEFFLRRIKPEMMITGILVLLVIGVVAIVVRDIMLKKKIDLELNHTKNIISEVALNLSTEKILSPITVSSHFLKEKAPEIKSITIYPDNHLEVLFNNLMTNNEIKTFIFSFDSIDSLTRGHLKCKGGDIKISLLPNQCRK